MLPPLKFCLEHPQNPLKKFQRNEQAGWVGLVKPGKPSKIVPICLVLGTNEKNILGQGINKVQAF